MALSDTIQQFNHLLSGLVKDMTKVQRGNKAAAQRVRVGTIKLEKVAKKFRKESVAAEKREGSKKRAVAKRSKKKKK